ncbi:MAG TPA: AAA family ATPase [Bosea sp. (in: a-proteobacteria)]|uniref:AAA family ATPase n=1 Tax=Bosea sp. (in: a-proteobacteria) TaxID=1871050 RepID=UPI002E0F51CF|nr:AAA family ATPase [Bosea sp. (in: a-proteobacteria)]
MTVSATDFTPNVVPLEFGDETPEQKAAIFAEYMAAHLAILRDEREALEQEFEARDDEIRARPRADNDNDPAGAKGAPLPVICPADWHGKPVPQRQWFIEGLIPSRTVTILNGDGGVGKSLLALQIGAAASLGVDTVGLTPARGGVVYMGAEDEADEFHRRLADIVASHDRTLADLSEFRLVPMADRDALLAIPNKDGVMQPTQAWLSLRTIVARHTPQLLILDTSADLYGGDEIKRAQVRGFVAMLRSVAMEFDCAVLLLSHPSLTGMQSGSGSSGSTAWNNSVRSRLYLTRPTGEDADSNSRTLSVMKANYGETGAGLSLRWKDGTFVADVGMDAGDVAMVTKHHDDVFMAILAKLNAQGINVSASTGTTYAPSVFVKHSEAKGIKKDKLGDAMRRLMDAGRVRIVKEGPPTRQRSRLVVA